MSCPPHFRASMISLLIAASASALSAQGSAADPLLFPHQKIETGVTFTSGDYGLADDTTVLSIPFTYVLEYERWNLRATIPWVQISGPASVVGGGTGSTGGPVRPTTASESGMGDSVLGVSYHFNPGSEVWNIDGSVRAKFPTGDDDRGIGTGEMDYFGQLEFYRSYGSVTPFAVIGYRILGNGRYQLDDGLYASLGTVVSTTAGHSLAVAFDWREKLARGTDDALEASLFLLSRHSARWNSTLGVMTGFNNSSLDYGLSGSLSYTF